MLAMRPSITSARKYMSKRFDRMRPALVCCDSLTTASPSRIQCGCTWFGARVLPSTALMIVGTPEMLSVCAMCVYSCVTSSVYQSS